VPVEVWEALTHTTVEYKHLLPDTGGAGKWRGGLGQEVVVRNDTGQPLTILGMGNRTMFPAKGFFGGRNGSLRQHKIDGKEVHAKGRFVVPPGSRVTLIEAGGAGLGDPKQRDRDAVARDVAEGYVSRGAASETYGWQP
jgi:N-methylhydantoinase B